MTFETTLKKSEVWNEAALGLDLYSDNDTCAKVRREDKLFSVSIFESRFLAEFQILRIYNSEKLQFSMRLDKMSDLDWYVGIWFYMQSLISSEM